MKNITKKKCLIIIQGMDFTKNDGVKTRINNFINSYNKNGIAVNVLLFFPLRNFPVLFKRKEYLNKNAKWYLFPNIPISYNRIVHKISIFFAKLIVSFLTKIRNFDFVQSEVSGILCKSRKNIKFLIVDYHGDSYSESIFKNRSHWFSEKMIEWQKISIQIADHNILVSENLKKQIERNSNNKFIKYDIISCSVDIDFFSKNEKIVNKFTNNNKIILGYIGGLQEWQNFDLLIEIISLLIKNEKNIYFMIFSNDDISKYISMLDNKIGHDNYLYKSLYHDEVPSYLKLLDAGFLLRKNEILNIVSSPTKILEYLASGVPVICTKYSGDFERSIQHEKEGFILSSSDPTPTELKKLLLFIKKVKYERDKYRKICENAAGNRTWNEEFQNFFNRLVI